MGISVLAPQVSTPGLSGDTFTPPPSSHKYKILVVDDEDDARELFVELLTTVSEYEVAGAVDGLDALAKSEAEKFDLILLDIVMPRKDGVQTLSELKAHPEKYGNPVIIMLTNIGGDIAIEEALKIGADGYKLKIDTEPEGLLKAVSDALAKKDEPKDDNKEDELMNTTE